MNEPSFDYLVLSRGHWDKDVSKEEIEVAIAKFYDWLEQNIAAGKMKTGSRLSRERAVVSKAGIVVNGAFCEAKEVVGGYWLIVARSLSEAATLAAENPCLQHGLTFEIRPIEAERASAYKPANETPAEG
jgi:hypothetical protein